MKIFFYLLLAAISLALFYSGYYFFLRKETRFHWLRTYLMVSVVFSFLLPFTPLDLELEQIFASGQDQALVESQGKAIDIATTGIEDFEMQPVPVVKETTQQWYESIAWLAVLGIIYIMIAVIFIGKFLYQLLATFFCFSYAKKEKMGKFILAYNQHFQQNFSFFRWIFINEKNLTPHEKQQIIEHEKIHATQYHSLDLIIIELLAAVMWFNPLIWKMRDAIQLVHEYLADEGALNTGIDKLQYQALLVNQVSEEKLICLSSSFNYSLIKKRMIMMTKSKLNQKSNIPFLSIAPVFAMAVLLMAITNGLFPNLALAGNEDKKSNSEIATMNDVEVVGYAKDSTIQKVSVRGENADNPAYYVDNKKTQSIKDIAPDDIASIDVNKDNNSVYLYTKHFNQNTIEIQNTNFEETNLNRVVIVDGIQQPNGKAKIEINPDDIKKIEVVKGKEQMNALGFNNYDVLVMITTKQNPEGTIETKDIAKTSQPTVTAIEPVKMNVLYLGIDNPIRIAVSGHKPEDIKVSMVNGVIEGSKGNYIARPRKPGIARIIVEAEGKEVQKTEFRVKRIPDPVATVAGKKGGNVSKNFLLAQTGVLAVMENFDFDLIFKVSEFTVTAVIEGFARSVPVKGNVLSEEQMNLIRKENGGKVYIEGIKAIGPYGIPRDLPAIVFTVL